MFKLKFIIGIDKVQLYNFILKAVYIHPKFDAKSIAPNHDIAILRLDKPVPILEGEIKPICLPLSQK